MQKVTDLRWNDLTIISFIGTFGRLRSRSSEVSLQTGIDTDIRSKMILQLDGSSI